MPAIRILAGLAAIGIFVWAVRGHERRQISRLNLIILFALCASVIALAITTPLRPLDAVRLRRGTDGVIFALRLPSASLILYLARRRPPTRRTEHPTARGALGQERFDWNERAPCRTPRGAFPPGSTSENSRPAQAIPAMIEVLRSAGGVSDAASKRSNRLRRTEGEPGRRAADPTWRAGATRGTRSPRLGAEVVVTLVRTGQHLP